MPCNHPLTAYRCEDKSIVFDERKGAVVHQLQLPCGRCEACKLERARQWAVRCVHESKLHRANCFITLTYNDDHLPIYGDLDYRDFQLFMKRLRKAYYGMQIRFFMCGEYGEDRGRPHFHACIFGLDFDDKVYLRTTPAGSKIYRSKCLDRLWSDKDGHPIGHASVGALNFDSAGYVARYVMKKRSGTYKPEYDQVDLETGEVYKKQEEFTHMSLKPGIGYGFLQKYKDDIYPQDVCIINGVAIKPPKYYYLKLAEEDPEQHGEVAERRQLEALKFARDNTPDRLRDKEIVLKARSKQLKRELT